MFHAWNIFFSFNSIFVANTSIFESSPAFFSWSLFPIHLIGKYNMKSHVKKCVQRKVEYFSFTDIVFSRGRLYPAFNKISPISLKATEESREESRDYIDFCFFSFPLCSKTCGGSRDKKVQWKKKLLSSLPEAPKGVPLTPSRISWLVLFKIGRKSIL